MPAAFSRLTGWMLRPSQQRRGTNESPFRGTDYLIFAAFWPSCSSTRTSNAMGGDLAESAGTSAVLRSKSLADHRMQPAKHRA